MVLKKILDNIGNKAVTVLGVKQYFIMLIQFIISIPTILREKNLVALDKRMSAFDLTVRVGAYKFRIDLPYNDQNIQENSFAFGGIREIFIRNCYFRFHDIDFSQIKTVVDLGGNRGIFSARCAPFASKIITIEPDAKYNNVITVNLKNANPNLAPIIINKFVGGPGMTRQEKGSTISFDQIINKNNIEFIDFLKIDIEGSEYGLFQEALPFDKIRYISLEVHRQCGNPSVIVQILENNYFTVTSSTSDFRVTNSSDEIDYIYAKNNKFSN